jgi:Holliday junction resolvase RusA-like endonuclease
VIGFDVLGTPAPKGSNRAILRGGQARFVPGGSPTNQRALKSWDVAVREAARDSVAVQVFDGGTPDRPAFVDQALAVEITFWLTRPGGHWAKPTKKNPSPGLKPSAPSMPAVKPDVDKLARATCDSLSGIVFDDDARIVELLVRKVYAEPGCEGARIVVRAC